MSTPSTHDLTAGSGAKPPAENGLDDPARVTPALSDSWVARRSFVAGLLGGLAYFLAAKASIFLALPPSTAAPVWPAAGVGIAVVTLGGWRTLPGVALGVLAFYLDLWLDPTSAESVRRTVMLSLALTVGPTLQSAVAALVVRRWVGANNPLLDDGSILRLLIVAGPLGCLIAATVDMLVLGRFGIVGEAEWALGWLTWWIGDSIGAMVVTPLILVLFSNTSTNPVGRKMAVALPLTLGLLLVVAAFDGFRSNVASTADTAFGNRAETLHHDFRQAMALDLNLIESLRTFMEASPWLDDRAFGHFVGPMLARREHVHALEWIPRVMHAQRARFEQFQPIVERGPDGRMVSAAVRESYLPVRFVLPRAGNEKAFGYDVSTAAGARAAQARAFDTRLVSASAPITLVQEKGGQRGVVIYAAVQPAATSMAHRVGLVAGVFRIKDYASAALARSVVHDMAVRLTDLGSNGEVLFETDDYQAAASVARSHGLSHRAILHVAGRQWAFDYVPTPAYLSAHFSQWDSWGLLTGGMLLSAVLGGWMLSLTGRTRQISLVVEERTQHLRQEVAARRRAQAELTKLSLAVAHSPSMVVMTDAKGSITYVNESFLRATGYDRDEVIGRPLSMLHADGALAEEDDHDEALTGEQVWERLHEQHHWSGELRARRRDGGEYWARIEVSPLYDEEEDGSLNHFVAMLQDITDEREHNELMLYQATHDELTGLVNRREFARRVDEALRVARSDRAQHLLCFIDLDQFKVVNDTVGHAAGDALLRQVADLLRESSRKADSVARLGGDEFGILMSHCPVAAGQRTAEGLRRAVADFRFVWEDQIFTIGASIGITAISADHVGTVTELFKQADAACYAAKDGGRNRVVLYAEDDATLSRRAGEIHWAARLGAALDEGRFELHGQLIAPLAGVGRQPRAELLIRLRDDDGELVSPGHFLPAAERYQYMTRIDRWVIDHAVDLLNEYPVLTRRLEYCAINLSGQSMAEAATVTAVEEALDRSGIAGERLMFEITETAAVSNLNAARELITRLRERGCRFALDDFGSGLSSFGYLKNLPVECLKIDGAFVRHVDQDPRDEVIVSAMCVVAKSFGLSTVAECVEGEAVVQVLRRLGVDYVQGFAVSRPVPIPELLKHPLIGP